MENCDKCKKSLGVCQWGTFNINEEDISYTCASCSFKEEFASNLREQDKKKELRSVIKDIIRELK